MGDIIGPYTQYDFRRLALLKHSIAFMKSTNRVRYDEAIQKETAIWKETIGGRV